MTDIPEDIFAKARALADNAVCFGYTQAALEIAEAIMAERERCAKIVARAAEKWANGKKSIGDGTQPAEILHAIRKQS